MVLFCIPVIPALSQNPSVANESPYTLSTHERVHVGIRGGLGLSLPSALENNSVKSESALSWSAGLTGSLKIEPRYHLEATVDYQQMTTRQSDPGIPFENTLVLDLITTNFGIRRDRIFSRKALPWSSFYLKAGPTVSYWMGGNGKVKLQGQEQSYPIHFPEQLDSTAGGLEVPGANRWMAGLDVGAGMSIPISRQQKFFVEVRGTIMITPLSDDDPSYLNIPGTSVTSYPVVLNQRLHSVWVTLSYTFVHNPMRSNLGRSTKEKQVKKRNPVKQKKTKSYLNTRIKSTPKK